MQSQYPKVLFETPELRPKLEADTLIPGVCLQAEVIFSHKDDPHLTKLKQENFTAVITCKSVDDNAVCQNFVSGTKEAVGYRKSTKQLELAEVNFFDFKDFQFGPGSEGRYYFHVDVYVNLSTSGKEFELSFDTDKEDNPRAFGVVEVVPRSAEAQEVVARDGCSEMASHP